MNRQSYIEAFKRILEIADRNHLYLPFKSDSKLRAKYFPGGGSKIERKKLIDAYSREFAEPNPDKKLLQHATLAWIHGYDASLTHILDDLKIHQQDTPYELPAARKRELEKKFTRTGTDEIAAFWTIYAAADNSYRKSVIKMLADVKPPEVAPPKMQPTQPSQQPDTASTQIEPLTQSLYALLGTLIFFVPVLIFTGIQYWRLPQESHWIALSITGIFGFISLIFLIDYFRKRNP